jgi:hypothetical protein
MIAGNSGSEDSSTPHAAEYGKPGDSGINFRTEGLMKIAIPRCMPRCKICKKPLKNSASITKGVGPECATKFAAMLVASGLTLESLGIPESISTDRVVARYLHVAEQALLAGRMGDVERFKTAAKETARRAAVMQAAA